MGRNGFVWTALACGLSLAACVPKPEPRPPSVLDAVALQTVSPIMACLVRMPDGAPGDRLDKAMECARKGDAVTAWLASGCGIAPAHARRPEELDPPDPDRISPPTQPLPRQVCAYFFPQLARLP